jgi:hypothetical protein
VLTEAAQRLPDLVAFRCIIRLGLGTLVFSCLVDRRAEQEGGARQSRPTPLATLGGRSGQPHHGMDGVPIPERTVDPAAVSAGGPGELAQPPALENSAAADRDERW